MRRVRASAAHRLREALKGPGCGRLGDHEGAARCVCHRRLGRGRGPGLPPAGADGERPPPARSRAAPAPTNCRSCAHCTTSWKKQVRQRDAFFAANEQFHLRLLEIAGNRWTLQIVTDLRKVMKLKPTPFAVQARPLGRFAGRASRADASHRSARCKGSATPDARPFRQRTGSRRSLNQFAVSLVP